MAVCNEQEQWEEAALELNDETRLYELGYKITGTSREKRWEILTTKAIPELGLWSVAYVIANHCQLRKLQFNGREKYRHAIGEWEYDLERIRREYAPADLYA